MPTPTDPDLPVAVLGTAGHIDHGKSTLVRALTGTDPDRLPEEKRRGITIELGYAALRLPSGRTVSVVDVPGHERFIKTMAAGAAVVDIAVLVVDAGDGVKPQTVEHLHILEALGVSRGLVALTKCDTVEEDIRRLAAEEVAGLLASTFLEGAPIVETSAETGAGLDDLRAAIDALVGDLRTPASRQPLRMPVDRSFVMAGFGTVLTGTLLGGSVGVEDQVAIEPAGARARVRGIQVHGGTTSRVHAPSRAALNLVGVDADSALRGQWVVEPGVFQASRAILAEIGPMPWVRKPLRLPAMMSMNLGSGSVSCEVHGLPRGPRQAPLAPSERGLVRIETGEPVVPRAGDRFILRAPGGLGGGYSTAAGGIVIDPLFGSRRLGPSLVEQVLAIGRGDPESWIGFALRGAGAVGLDPDELTQRVPAPPADAARALDRILQRRGAVKAGKRTVVGSDAWMRALARADASLAAYHSSEPEKAGIKRDELRDLVTGPDGAALFDAVMKRRIAEDAWKLVGDLVAASGHRPGSDRLVRELAERMMAETERSPHAPPTLEVLAGQLGATPEEARRSVNLLVSSGRARLLTDEFLFTTAFLAKLAGEVRTFLGTRDSMLVTDLKAIAGVTRKHALPLARYLDDEGITVRRGDQRFLKR